MSRLKLAWQHKRVASEPKREFGSRKMRERDGLAGDNEALVIFASERCRAVIPDA